jgi:hypothetical protein
MSPSRVVRSIVTLQLPSKVRKDTIEEEFRYSDYHSGFFQEVGNLRFAVLPKRNRPSICKLVFEQSIKPDIAKQLAEIGPCDKLFTFETIKSNGAIFQDFLNVASLYDILELRAMCPFDLSHAQIVTADVSIDLLRVAAIYIQGV